MAKEKKYVAVALEMYEMLLIKAETLVNPIASTIKQNQENLNTFQNCVETSEEEKVRFDKEEVSKLRRAKDERSAAAYPLQKASIDKVKEEKMNVETTSTQSLPVTLRSRGKLVKTSETTFKHYFVERTRTDDL